MKGLKIGLVLCIATVFIVLAILCHVIALSTNYWITSSNNHQTNFLNIGLWVACFDDYFHPHEYPPRKYDGCHDVYSNHYKTIQDWLVPGWLVAGQVLALIGLGLLVVGTLVVVLLLLWWFCKWMCCCDGRADCCEKCMIYTAPILFILAGAFIMMVVMIFADNAFRLQCRDFWVGGEPNDNFLGFSWGLEIAGCLCSFVAGGFLIWMVVLKAREEI